VPDEAPVETLAMVRVFVDVLNVQLGDVANIPPPTQITPVVTQVAILLTSSVGKTIVINPVEGIEFAG
jgi:hypothetical protein